MSLRVVLYAEGGRELYGAERSRLAPGDLMPVESLGPAHLLLQRCLGRVRRIPSAAVLFEEPLRTTRGLVPRGGHLANPRILRQLLTWPDPTKQPALAVVFVDADGEGVGRKRTLSEAITALSVNAVIGVAVEEFEAWMIADAAAVRRACELDFDVPEEIERLPPREPKVRLERALQHSDPNVVRERRLTIASSCNLDTVAKRCASFADLLAELSGRG